MVKAGLLENWHLNWDWKRGAGYHTHIRGKALRMEYAWVFENSKEATTWLEFWKDHFGCCVEGWKGWKQKNQLKNDCSILDSWWWWVDQGISSEGSDKWLDSEYISKVELTGFAERWDEVGRWEKDVNQRCLQ